MRIPAPAKLNLFLHVTGRRPDGYHLLHTLFRFIEYGDELSLTLRPDGQVSRGEGPREVAPEQDLSVRAARLLQAETGCKLGVDLRIVKRIPMGGGLGGGSSDAASVLVGLNRLWGLGLSRPALMVLGAKLGADVPVFVFGRSAFAQGVGDELSAIRIAPAWYVVLTPSIHVATTAVFAEPKLTRNSNPLRIPAFFAGQGRNDLEAVVRERHVEVDRCLRWLAEQGPATMSGSGACVFRAVDSEAQARAILARLPENMAGFVARGLDQHPLYHWLNHGLGAGSEK
ncbi:MAG: 4-(cytidine 5'-diphospho)-2-C-methyl-D-erythritol kinase [Betaproteobacteria bacterium]|nr:4-(cytidine 5'-diphospho)-2-C-methyl-D-erythritol kinase [Betaproteobacteria bacterium]